MKREIRFFWPDVGRLLIRFRKDGGAVLSYRPSRAAIIEGLHKAAQSPPEADPTEEDKLHSGR